MVLNVLTQFRTFPISSSKVSCQHVVTIASASNRFNQKVSVGRRNRSWYQIPVPNRHRTNMCWELGPTHFLTDLQFLTELIDSEGAVVG